MKKFSPKLMQTAIAALLIGIIVLCNSCSDTIKSSEQPSSTSIPKTTTVKTATYTVPQLLIAPLMVDKNFSGQTVKVNLIKFTGSAIPGTQLEINGDKPIVNRDGDYYIYLDLEKGQNVINIETTAGNEIKIEQYNIFFVPPLSVRLHAPRFESNTVFTSPTSVIGVVSEPTAKVTVNGIEVAVNMDGTFFAQILCVKGNNHAEAVAQLADETDTYYLNWTLADNGHLMTKGGPIVLPYQLPEVTLKSGETISVDLELLFAKTIPNGSLNEISIIQTAKLNDERSVIEMELGLIVSIEPSAYHIYPGIGYHSQIMIEAVPSLLKGKYYYFISSSLFKGAYFTKGSFLNGNSLTIYNTPLKGAGLIVNVQ